MKKKYIILGISLLVIICVIILSKIRTNDDKYYRYVADTIVGFYHSDEYDENKIKEKDRPIISEYLSHLTHKNEEILLDEYITKSNAFYVNSPNTSGVYIKNDKCYIKYEDIGFDQYHSEDLEIEPNREIICNNYKTYLYYSYFAPKYSDTVNNPRYDYIYQKMAKNMSTYTFTYISTYDDTYINVMIITNDNKIFNIKTEEGYNEV